jgi:hypothetical protein
MYLPLATVAGVHLSDVRERLLSLCTLESPFPRIFFGEIEKSFTPVTGFFFSGTPCTEWLDTTPKSNLNLNMNV